MNKKNEINRKIIGIFCTTMMVMISLNIVIISLPVAAEEGETPDIHIDEIGFSGDFTNTLANTMYCPSVPTI